MVCTEKQERTGFKTSLTHSPQLEAFFLLLSGENPTLPRAEVAAILDSERCPVADVLEYHRIVRLRTTQLGVQAVARRAAYTRTACREIFSCEANESKILEMVGTTSFNEFLNQGEAFKVEVVNMSLHHSHEPVDTRVLEAKIGRAILDEVPRARVDLSRDSKTFCGVATSESFLLGLSLDAEERGFGARRLHSRPFFHPSAMQPKLARCMVNLSRARPGEVFLDAFCGTGSQLVEAASIGCTVLGSDIDPRMIRGAAQNLLFSCAGEHHLCVADARSVPFKSFDSCASDPPYGRGSSTHGAQAGSLVRGFLARAIDALGRGDYLCLAFPEGGGIREFGVDAGFKVLETHLVREHKSLTREVAVLKKP